MVVWDAENAAHLISRAGFGGDERDVERYFRYGQLIAVEKLVAVKGTGSKGPGKSGDAATDPDDLLKLRIWWAKRMVKATSRRLQEKMCLFWHDHFASSVSTVKNNLWMSQQNALFRRHGLGPFKTLVFEITRDPAMLEFLDGNRNRVGKPNENYARELMELFVLRDEDRFRMTCVPAKDTTPCDGVTSTFEQLQRQIFTPTCAISTCHNAVQAEHQLSLAPGEAYANLVGVPPANTVANGAGLLRVDPGDPDNSFIMKKLRGELGDGEGDRMPRDLKPLHHLHVDLLEEWIAAGAPETGFAASFGCE